MRYFRRLVMAAILMACLLLPSIAQAGEPYFIVRSIRRPMATEIYSEPAISGDWVAYSVESVAVPKNVWVTNLKTRASFALRAQTKRQYDAQVSGTKVVWYDRRDDNDNIYLYDLVTKKETTVTGGLLAPGRNPDISGNRVVYDTNANVMVYDIVTGQKTLVGPGIEPRISGDWVVYYDFGPNARIRAYNVSTREHIDLTSRPPGQQQIRPDIEGSMVVWEGFDGVANQLWWKDLANPGSSPTAVVGAGDNPSNATVSNNRIYYKADNGNDGLWIYDIGSQALTPAQLTDDMLGADRLEAARPDGNLVVYRMQNDLLLGTVDAPTVSIARPSGSVPYNSQVTLTGSIWDFGFPIGNISTSDERLKGQLSRNAWNWATSLAYYGTDSDGAYSIKMPPITTKTYYRVNYFGEYNPFEFKTHLGAMSEIRTVWPRVALGKPTVRSKLKRNKAFTAWNYVEPKQNAGSKPIKFEYWRKTRGRYRLDKSVWATVSDYSATKGKYSAKTSLKHSGKWRIRAVYPTSATNAYTVTGWVYRTVP